MTAMDYLVVYSGGRPPEHWIYDEDSENDYTITRRYLCWVQEGICRVFRVSIHELDLTFAELQRNGEFLEASKEFPS